MRVFAEQIRAYIPNGRTYKVLGTDGFGRSDIARQAARVLRGEPLLHHGCRAEVAGRGRQDPGTVVQDAIAKYGIDPNKPNPVTQ